MREHDVLVLGAGLSGGLPAAAYLQKAGLDVALLEAGPQCGVFYRSYERGGVLFDHSPVNFSAMSPVVHDLDLASYGYAVRPPPVLHTAYDADGHAVTFYREPERTVAELERYSRADAETFAALRAELGVRAPELVRTLIFSPEPDREAAVEATAEAVGMTAAALESTTGPQLVERLFESDPVRVALTALPALNLFGDLLAPGQGALSWLWTLLLRACEAPAGNGSLVAVLERAFVDAGGTLLTSTPVRELHVELGVCTGVTAEVGGRPERIRARRAVISNLGAGLMGDLLGAGAGPLAEKLASWRSAGRTLATADLVLARPLRLGGDAARSPRVYLLWPGWEACLDWLRRARQADESVFFGHYELTQLHVPYGTRDGRVGLRVRFGTGPFLDGGGWDARRERFERELRRRLEELDPGIVGEIREFDLVTPLDHWRSNPAALHGNPVGGDFVEGQWLGERLPYRTPIERLYLSNSVWPPALSWMAAGYNAACVVAEDLGVRDRPWWRHDPAAVYEGRASALPAR